MTHHHNHNQDLGKLIREHLIASLRATHARKDELARLHLYLARRYWAIRRAQLLETKGGCDEHRQQ